jgi:hypothetical protein
MQDIAEGEGAPFLPREGNKKDDPSLVCNSHTRSKWAEYFIMSTPENPVLWTGMKGASAEGRKKAPDAETSSA